MKKKRSKRKDVNLVLTAPIIPFIKKTAGTNSSMCPSCTIQNHVIHVAAPKSTVSVHQQDLNECIQGDSSSTEWRAELYHRVMLYVAFEASSGGDLSVTLLIQASTSLVAPEFEVALLLPLHHHRDIDTN
ncbi:uncharacterized protein [Asterias amurensis]|uniref:uncharacterized protein n=1 Tax=Asterias amurensis TaxID=7602 RepID=UPI003AB4AA68